VWCPASPTRSGPKSDASRIYIVAERVEFLASRKPSNGQASDEASTEQPASGEAREAHQAA
jgi:hypothetical protein